MRIVMTGFGAMTPLGAGVEALWAGLLDGRSGVRDLSGQGPRWAELPVAVGAPVEVDLSEALGRVRARQLDRSQQLALLAAAEAWADAGQPEVDPERLAVVVGTGIGGVTTLLDQDDVLEQQGARRVSPRTVPMLMPNGAAAQISIEYNAQAGTFTPVSACSAGAEAIATGARMIRDGDADVVIAGGVEAAMAPLTLAAFAQSQAVAKPNGGPVEALSRPFDRDRHGFVLGEGAGIVVLEREDHARARGARIRARLAGWGITSDAHHITAPEPTGRGQIRALRKALALAELSPDDIDHINAHATGTSVGDRAEALMLQQVLGTRPAVFAPKGNLGHLVGAAGAVEAIITALSVESGIVPATLNFGAADDGVDLDIVSGAARSARIAAAVSNSFGFGGQNVTLAITRA